MKHSDGVTRDMQIEQSFEEHMEGKSEVDKDLLDFDSFLEVDEAVETLNEDKYLGMVSMIESIFESEETSAFKIYSIVQLLVSQCEDKDEMNNISQLFLFREVAKERLTKEDNEKD